MLLKQFLDLLQLVSEQMLIIETSPRFQHCLFDGEQAWIISDIRAILVEQLFMIRPLLILLNAGLVQFADFLSQIPNLVKVDIDINVVEHVLYLLAATLSGILREFRLLIKLELRLSSSLEHIAEELSLKCFLSLCIHY